MTVNVTDPARPDAVISGYRLGQRYRTRWIFSGLDISVGSGITALLGPNGAGKTTLLNTVVGLRRPAAGRLFVLGADMARRGGLREVAAKVGFLPQTVGYHPGYTVRDSVAYAGWLKGLPSRDLPGQVNAALDRVGLSASTHTRMGTLSGGMLRRAGIAQAIVAGPRLLVLDEPTAGLDPQQRIEFRRLLRDIASEASVLLSTHSVDDVAHLADRVLVMANGIIAFDGTLAGLRSAGTASTDGDNEIERGYLGVLAKQGDGSP